MSEYHAIMMKNGMTFYGRLVQQGDGRWRFVWRCGGEEFTEIGCVGERDEVIRRAVAICLHDQSVVFCEEFEKVRQQMLEEERQRRLEEERRFREEQERYLKLKEEAEGALKLFRTRGVVLVRVHAVGARPFVKVRGTCWGHFAIHRQVDGAERQGNDWVPIYSRKKFALTHVPSGLAITSSVSRAALALVAKRISDMAPWGKEKPLEGMSKKEVVRIKKAIEEVLEEMTGGA